MVSVFPTRRLVDRSSSLVRAGALPGRERLLQRFRRSGGIEAAHQRDLPTGSTIKTLMELLQLLHGDLAHSGGLLIERRYVAKVARRVRREIAPLGLRRQRLRLGSRAIDLRQALALDLIQLIRGEGRAAAAPRQPGPARQADSARVVSNATDTPLASPPALIVALRWSAHPAAAGACASGFRA